MKNCEDFLHLVLNLIPFNSRAFTYDHVHNTHTIICISNYQRYWKSLSLVTLFTSFQAILQPAGLKFFKSNSKASLPLRGRDYEFPLANEQSKIFYDKQLFPQARCVKIQFYTYLVAFQIWLYLIWNHLQEFHLSVRCWEPNSFVVNDKPHFKQLGVIRTAGINAYVTSQQFNGISHCGQEVVKNTIGHAIWKKPR